MRRRTLDSLIRVPFPREEVFPFFADIRNLDRITPPWLHFRIETNQSEVKKGTIIRYRLRIHGVPVQWVSEITEWEPPGMFVDEQRKGPYLEWIHEHRFVPEGQDTLILDHVDYRIPGWILEPWIHRLLVGPDLAKVFEFRKQWLQNHFQRKEAAS